MLGEAQLHQHLQQRSVSWLIAIRPLIQVQSSHAVAPIRPAFLAGPHVLRFGSSTAASSKFPTADIGGMTNANHFRGCGWVVAGVACQPHTAMAEVTGAVSVRACAVQTLGLVTVRYFGRLMPLLLGWVQSPDAVLQTEALRTLAVVVQAAWPRMAAHAAVLWRHVDAAHCAANLPNAAGTPAALEVAQRAQTKSFHNVGRLLFWCCSDAFKQRIQVDSHDSALAQAVVAGVSHDRVATVEHA